jgi:hypothetical protein
MDDAAPWHAFAADGVSPSTDLALTIDVSRPRFGVQTSSGRVSGSVGALNHTLRRTVLNLDLTKFNELRLWLYSDRPADGTPARPFFLELRLASATVAIGAPGNTWQRYFPISQTNTWESVRLSISDLPAAIRSAVNLIQLRCADATTSFRCNVDDVIAVLDEMIGDVDSALLASLNGILVINSHPVPAVLHPANGTLTQARPYIEVMQYDVVYSRERTQSTRPRADFTDQGYSLRPPSNAYELYYQITAVADDRNTQSQILEFILRTVTPRGALVVNGYPLPMDALSIDPEDQLAGVRAGIPLFYKISTRQEVGVSDTVSAARVVIIDGDIGAPP